MMREYPVQFCESLRVRFLHSTRLVVCFENKYEPRKFRKLLEARLLKFNLSLEKDKTKEITFGRFAKEDLKKEGKRPETFDFLGFKHVCGKSRKGKFEVIRIPTSKACSKFCERTLLWLRKHRHWRVRDQQKYLSRMLKGFYQYFSLNNCLGKLGMVHSRVLRMAMDSI